MIESIVLFLSAKTDADFLDERVGSQSSIQWLRTVLMRSPRMDFHSTVF